LAVPVVSPKQLYEVDGLEVQAAWPANRAASIVNAATAPSGERLLIVRVPHCSAGARALAVCDCQCSANVAARVVAAAGGQRAGGRY
jgi:hypothetical protein